MPSKKFKVTGIAYWVKIDPDNLDMGYQGAWEPDGRSSLNLDLTKEEFAKLKKAGTSKQGKVSPDDPDLIRVSLDRPFVSPDWDEANKFGGLPKIVFKDGEAYDADTDPAIGNESEVTVIGTCYTTRMAGRNGTRMDKIIINNLVEYDPDNVDDDDDDEEVQKKEPEKKAKKQKPPVSDDIEDEIPF